MPGRPDNYTSNLRVFMEFFLGETLEGYIERRRGEDPPRSWQGIADDMRDRINAEAARLDATRPWAEIKISQMLPHQISKEAERRRADQ